MMMEKKRLLKVTALTIISIIVLLFSCTNNHVEATNIFAPTWLKKGAYAEYSLPSAGERIIVTQEGATITTKLPEAVLMWECVDVNSTFGKMKINFYYNETENQDKKVEETEQYTVELFVDIFSRAVYHQNGTLIGTTFLWLPPNPSPGEDIVLWDVPPDRISLTVPNLDQIQTRVLTPQGSQPAFRIEKQVTINGESVFLRGLYDFDTGVLCNGLLLLPEHPEPTIKALDLSDYAGGTIILVDTNIDLGPNANPLDLRTIFTVIGLAVAFIIIFVASYRRRTKRR